MGDEVLDVNDAKDAFGPVAADGEVRVWVGSDEYADGRYRIFFVDPDDVGAGDHEITHGEVA